MGYDQEEGRVVRFLLTGRRRDTGRTAALRLREAFVIVRGYDGVSCLGVLISVEPWVVCGCSPGGPASRDGRLE